MGGCESRGERERGIEKERERGIEKERERRIEKERERRLENFGGKFFMASKIISSKIGMNQKFLIENFLWLQNNFLANRYIPEMFI